MGLIGCNRYPLLGVTRISHAKTLYRQISSILCRTGVDPHRRMHAPQPRIQQGEIMLFYKGFEEKVAKFIAREMLINRSRRARPVHA